MASTSNNLFIVCFLLFVLPCISQTSSKPKAFVISVSKHETYDNIHSANIIQRNPLRSTKLLVDLGATTSWINCELYNHTTHKYAQCKSTTCSLSKAQRCSKICLSDDFVSRCLNDACLNKPVNLVNLEYIGAVTEDLILVQSTDGSKLGQADKFPGFIFTCVPTWFTSGVPDEIEGLAAFGTSAIGLPTQVAKAFSIPRKFGMCLSSIKKAKGFVIFGDGPYVTYPNVDVSKNLIYTPLISNPFNTDSDSTIRDASSQYFIGVKSIKINGTTVKLNTSLLSIDNKGNGGTRIMTTDRYTYMEASIYKAVTEEFIKHVNPTAKRLEGYAPFEFCYSTKSLGSSTLGPTVPTIDLVFENQDVFWRIYGANSMIQVEKDLSCLGFVSRDFSLNTITIGLHLIEDNLLQFDLEKSRLGFSSSLLYRGTKCSNFNFTSHA